MKRFNQLLLASTLALLALGLIFLSPTQAIFPSQPLSMSAISGQSLGSSSIQDGLVAYYPFNGNADDESGNGNDGTVVGATLTTDRLGNPNSAYSFDGNDDYIDLGTQYIIDDSAAFSVAFWANIAGGSDDGPTMIRLKGNTSEFQYSFRTETGNAIYSGFRGFSSITTNESQYTLDNLQDEWHHHIIEYDGGDKNSLGSYNVYIDGVAISLEFFNIIGGSTNENVLGRDWLGLNYLEGMLDQVRIYNH